MTAEPSEHPATGDDRRPVGRFEWERVLRELDLSDIDAGSRRVAASTVKLVGLMLASYASSEGSEIYPGDELIARQAQVAAKTVQDARAVLRAVGMLRTDRPATRTTAAEHQLTLPSDLVALRFIPKSKLAATVASIAVVENHRSPGETPGDVPGDDRAPRPDDRAPRPDDRAPRPGSPGETPGHQYRYHPVPPKPPRNHRPASPTGHARDPVDTATICDVCGKTQDRCETEAARVPKEARHLFTIWQLPEESDHSSHADERSHSA